MKSYVQALLALATVWSGGCGTYYDPTDSYTLGLRWCDRGRMDLAEREWKPLVDKSDPDAQFRYGWLLWTNVLGANRELEAIDLFRKAADQGQAKALLILADLYYQSANNPVWSVKTPPFPRDVQKALVLYLRAQKVCYYAPEKEALARVLPKIKTEVDAQKIRAAELEVEAWKPTIVGREPRRLL
jgi:TPR repeat protein